MGNSTALYVWLVAGFVLFLALEQFLNWHHSHSNRPDEKQPLTYLILIADALHNFIGGLFVAASFLVDFKLGVIAWMAAAAHEVPQERPTCCVMQSSWQPRRATLRCRCSIVIALGGECIRCPAE